MLSTLSMAVGAGLLSTIHCWGMCGGVVAALALGVPTAMRARTGATLALAVAYNTGRVGSYVMLGALAGLIALPAGRGEWAYRVLQLAGLVTLVFAGLRLGGWRSTAGWFERSGLRLWRHVSPLTRHFLPIDRLSRALPAGLLWGLLPCGLVYAMLPVAAGSGSVGASAATMAAFGLGTLPGMVLASTLANRLGNLKPGPGLRRYAGASLIALACMWFGLQWLGGSHQDHAVHAGHAGHPTRMPEAPDGHADHAMHMDHSAHPGHDVPPPLEPTARPHATR